MSVQVVRRSFTVDEYYRMAEAGILSEDDRVELLEGEIVEMPPIGSRHASCVDRLNRLFSQRVGDRALVRVQNPVRPFLPVIKSQRDLWSAAESDQVCGMAYVGIAQGLHDADTPSKRLLLVDCWKFDLTTGKIVAQENFYDPRLALARCTSCGGTATRGCSCPK